MQSLLGTHWPSELALDRVLSLGLTELNSVLILNWIVWNRTVFMFKLSTYTQLNIFENGSNRTKLRTYVKLNCLK